MQATLRHMFAACDVGIAFNAITDVVDYRSDDLWYSNAGEMLRFCQTELSRHVTLRHDYPLYEYTVYVYRNPGGDR